MIDSFDRSNRLLLRLQNVGKTFQMGVVAVEALHDGTKVEVVEKR